MEGRPTTAGQSTVVASHSLSSLVEHFVQTVGEAKKDKPLAPLTVIVGSNLQHIYLRRRLAEAYTAVANIRFLTLLDLAGEIHLSTGATRALLPLPEGGEALILRSVCEDSGLTKPDSPLAADVTGLPEAIAATVRDLREGMVEAEDIQQALPSSSKAKALAEVLRAFSIRNTEFIDRTRRLEDAAAAALESVDEAIPPGPVLIYGIYDLNELQLDVISKVLQCRQTTVFIPWAPDHPSYRFATPTIDRLKSLGLELVELEAGGAQPTRAEVTMFSSSDRHAEIEEVVRRILADVEDGVPLSDIAVLHHLDQGYDELFEEVLERASVPRYIAAGRPVRNTAVGKATLNLLSLLCEEPRRGSLLELLSLPCIGLDWIEADLRPRPSQWENISKEVGLVRGWDEFVNLLSRCIQEIGSGYSGERERYKRDRASSLLKVVQAFAGLAAKARSMDDWSSLAGWFASLLDQVIRPGNDRETLAAIRDRVELLGVLDTAAVPCDLHRFREAAEKAIRRASMSGGYFQRDGVFVGNVVAARGLRFRRVYVTECAERVFPPFIRQDPLLLDAERHRINRSARNGSLPIKRRRLDEERLLFELVCQSARERLTISYARRANLSSTPRLPSSLLLEEARRLSGTFQSIEALERASHQWFVRNPSRVGYAGNKPDDALRALDQSDLRLHVLESGGLQAVRAIQALWPGLDRARRMWKERRAGRFGPFDGIVPADLVTEARVLQQNLSASSLSDYAACPYRFLMSRVLGLQVEDEPEETLQIDAADKGAFVHRVLERLVSQFLAGNDTWRDFLANSEATVASIIKQETERLPIGTKGLPVSWQIVRNEIEADVRLYLEEELAQAASGWLPVAAERWFHDVPIKTGAGTMMVRGAIDRLDRNGDALRVVDYKTGGVRDKADGYRTGDSLQLPLYLTAACKEHEVPISGSQSEFHFVSRKGSFARVTLAGEDLARDDRFETVLGHMIQGIASGAFFYWPQDGRANCKFCDFFDVCHSQVDRMATSKAPESSDAMQPWRSIRDDRRSG